MAMKVKNTEPCNAKGKLSKNVNFKPLILNHEKHKATNQNQCQFNGRKFFSPGTSHC